MKPATTHTTCTTCDKPIKLRPCHIGKFKKNYCDNVCRTGEKFSWLGYVHANCKTSLSKDIASHIGIPVPTLRTWVFLMNKELPDNMRIRFTKTAGKRMEPIRVGKVKKAKLIKTKTIKMPILKKKPMATQATQHGPMLAGKGLINQNSTIALRNPFNPATHERVYVPERKCYIERRKAI